MMLICRLFMKSSLRCALATIVACVLAAPTSARAQDIRGTVLEANDSTPVSGAVVMLMHPTRDSVFARIVTGDRGFFTLRAPAGRPVRLRVLRLGYLPTNGGTFTVGAGQVETVRIRSNGNRVALATFDIESTKRCEVRPDSARLVAQLYEEARKALLASASVVSGVRHQSQFVLFNRVQDDRAKLRQPIKRNSFVGPSFKPFASIPADSLAKSGFVVEKIDGVLYHAPDAEILLADVFLSSHCLQLVNGTGERAASIGIGFRPTGQNIGKRLVDVKGTLWLDRDSNELQYLEYEYVGLPDDLTRVGVGGRVDYTQMSGGFWFVSKWAIRMPAYKPGVNLGGGVAGVTAANLVGLTVGGGEVQWIKADDETVYSNPGAVLAGSEPTDMRYTEGVRGNIETRDGSTEVVNVSSMAEVDSVFGSASCQEFASEGYTGQVRGKVRDANGKALDSLSTVWADWKDSFRLTGRSDFAWQNRRVETKTNADGEFVICGLPTRRVISLSATNGGRDSRVGLIRLTEQEPRTALDLSIKTKANDIASTKTKARESEVRVVDPFGVPIAFATISLSAGNVRVADREGRVTLNIAPRESMRLLARRIGYQAFDGEVVREDSTGAYRITLAPVVQKLGTVTVNDRLAKSPLELTGFYERVREVQRGALRGEFFTPEDLNARPSPNIAQFLQMSRFVSVTRGPSGVWVVYGRAGCPMAVVLDGVQVGVTTNPRAGRGSDITDVAPLGQVSAIEVYPSVANAPASINFAVKDGNCGVVAIWTGGRGK